MNATYKGKDRNWQNEQTVYWFDIDGETWGVSDINGERTIVDCDGSTVNVTDPKCIHLPKMLIVTEEMELD